MVYRLRNVRISLVLLIYSMVVSEDSKMDRSQLRFSVDIDRASLTSFGTRSSFNNALEEEGRETWGKADRVRELMP